MKKIVIEIEQFQLTLVVTLMCVLTTLSFLAGYFWGKKSVLQEFADQIKNESFADKVYASLYSLKDIAGSSEDTLHSREGGESESESELESDKETDGKGSSESEGEVDGNKKASFVAQLISYHTKRQAEDYVRTLKLKGIAASVCERAGTSSKGKKRIWYQVVSDPASYTQTENMIKRLSLEDRLAGVTMVETPMAMVEEVNNDTAHRY